MSEDLDEIRRRLEAERWQKMPSWRIADDIGLIEPAPTTRDISALVDECFPKSWQAQRALRAAQREDYVG